MPNPLTIASTAASVIPVVEQSIIARIKPHINRALNARRNLDDLRTLVEKLKNTKEVVQDLVDEARDNQGLEIHWHVEKWLKKVELSTRDDTPIEDDDMAKKSCFIGLCPNYATRYSMSVKMEKGAKEVAELLDEGARYDAVEKISRRPPALATRVIKQIVDALASGKNLIGLYGIGGVGKTTLVKVLAKQVVEEELFDKVVIGTITHNPNVEVIQEEIAESLGLKFEEKGERVRASRLRAKLEQEEKILVILDDLWGRIDLEVIGIPFPDQQKGLKILMISRDEHVLSREMGAEKTFQLQVSVPDTQSRNFIIKQIVDALASDKNLFGLYGMGGVGKTTLVKVIAALVLEEELFDKVVICTITMNVNVKAIQEEIAESLGLKFEETSERVRASRLRAKLKQEQKILVILDDLWKGIDLEAIGIPFPYQQKGLKILMTSRAEDVLSHEMGAEEIFLLQVLSPHEAWDLFQKMVGDVKDPFVSTIAKEVARRCGGLPVLLATVARALRVILERPIKHHLYFTYLNPTSVGPLNEPPPVVKKSNMVSEPKPKMGGFNHLR